VEVVLLTSALSSSGASVAARNSKKIFDFDATQINATRSGIPVVGGSPEVAVKRGGKTALLLRMGALLH